MIRDCGILSVVPLWAMAILIAQSSVCAWQGLPDDSPPDVHAQILKLQDDAIRLGQEGKFEESEVARMEILQLTEKLHGSEDWRTIDAKLALSDLRLQQGMSAEQLAQLVTANENLDSGIALQAQGRPAEGVDLCRDAILIRVQLLGRKHIATARAHNVLASLYMDLRQLEDAELHYRICLSICEEAVGAMHPETGGAVNNLAKLYAAQSKYDVARSLFLRSLEIARKAHGDFDASVAATLGHLAGVLKEVGKFEQAEILYNEDLRICRALFGDEHLQTATTLNNLASLYWVQSRYREAIPLYQMSLNVRRKLLGQQHSMVATSLNNLANAYQDLGEFDRAENLFRESLAISMVTSGAQHPETAAVLDNLARLCVATGRFEEAESRHRRSHEIRTAVLGPEHESTILSVHYLATLYTEQGDYAKAEPLFLQCIDGFSRTLGPGHPRTAMSLGNLANLYGFTGDHAKAVKLMTQCLEIQLQTLPPTHPDLALTRSNLAVLCFNIQDYQQAESLLNQSLEALRQSVGDNHPTTALMIKNLAAVHLMQGHLDVAEPLLLKALSINETTLGSDHATTGESHRDLGLLHYYRRQYDMARAQFEKSIAINSRAVGDVHPNTVFAVSNLSFTHFCQGDFASAEQLAVRALTATKISLEAMTGVQSERQQLAMAHSLRHRLDGYLSIAVASGQFAEQAYREVLSWKGATMVRQQQMRKVASDVAVAPLFRKLQQNAIRLATLSRLIPEVERHAAWQQQVADLTAEKERLEVELSRHSAEFRGAQKRITREDLLIALPEDAVLIDYLEYVREVPRNEGQGGTTATRSIVTFVIRHDQPVVMLDLGPTAPVSEAIDTWRTTFGTSVPGAAAGRLLRQRLWEPLEVHLADARLVLISVDGALGRLPFAGLPGRKLDTFLLEEYRLAMLPVPQLLPALVNDPGRRELANGMLLMGDVNYDDAEEAASPVPQTGSGKRSQVTAVRGDLQFSALAGTAGEVSTISELFTQRFQPEPDALRMLHHKFATEQEFRLSASRFRNLHLATHGFFAAAEYQSVEATSADDQQRQMLAASEEQLLRGYNPGLLSGLAFSGANRKPQPDQDDGILTADEIASLSLDGVDLVVLSACETGLGEVAGGEGLLGVQRAFQVAGAQSTIASLWQVDDAATRRLMEAFYNGYWKNQSDKIDALRNAQLYLLNHPESLADAISTDRGDQRLQAGKRTFAKRLSPEFWAAFSLSGDWR